MDHAIQGAVQVMLVIERGEAQVSITSVINPKQCA